MFDMDLGLDIQVENWCRDVDEKLFVIMQFDFDDYYGGRKVFYDEGGCEEYCDLFFQIGGKGL